MVSLLSDLTSDELCPSGTVRYIVFSLLQVIFVLVFIMEVVSTTDNIDTSIIGPYNFPTKC